MTIYFMRDKKANTATINQHSKQLNIYTSSSPEEHRAGGCKTQTLFTILTRLAKGHRDQIYTNATKAGMQQAVVTVQATQDRKTAQNLRST